MGTTQLGTELALRSVADEWDAPAPALDSSRSVMFADTLAWAVSHNIPIHEALQTLPFYVRQMRTPGLSAGRKWAFLRNISHKFTEHFLWQFPNIRWSWNLDMVVRELQSGQTLSDALNRHLRPHFPRYFILGIAKAERDGRLGDALPVLARQLSLPISTARERLAEWWYVGARAVTAMYVLMFLILNVVPKLHCIVSDLADDADVRFGILTTLAARLMSSVLVPLGMVGLFMWKGGRWGEWLCMKIPFIGRERKRFIVSDFAAGMAAFLRQGADIPDAAEWCSKATRSFWLRTRIGTFIKKVRSGAEWSQAWREMKIGLSLCDWWAVNSAAREDPASGFDLMCEWLDYEIRASTHRMRAWVDPVGTMILGLIVGMITYEFFNCLRGLVQHIMDSAFVI